MSAIYAFAKNTVARMHIADVLSRDHSLYGGVMLGLDGYIIEIQARAFQSLAKAAPWRSAVTMTGMHRDSCVSLIERLSGAFSKLGIPDPTVAIKVNLTPAGSEKHGTALDLPLAVIMLQAIGFLPDLSKKRETEYILAGEIGLHGDIRPVPGILGIALKARPGQTLIVPKGNEKECALILAKPGHEKCRICPVSTLQEVIDHFQGWGKLQDASQSQIQFESHIQRAPDFGLIKGQKKAKEAAVIAAAGGHNLLLVGPPGEGKSLLASAIPGILPRLTDAEKVELTRIYSAQGMLSRDGSAVTRRPMRTIHSTASRSALIGGGSGVPKPGEISLAHLGVLFLDEIAEFPAATLEALRQPMESGTVTVSRVGATLTFPSRFALIAAMNPCPCGYLGSPRCQCKDGAVRRYQSKISGPIMDRIDLKVAVEPLTIEERFDDTPPEQGLSQKLRIVVEAAREAQTRRFAGTSIACNAAIPAGWIQKYCQMSNVAKDMLKDVVDKQSLSTRGMDRLCKVARTIADLKGLAVIDGPCIVRAAEFVSNPMG